MCFVVSLYAFLYTSIFFLCPSCWADIYLDKHSFLCSISSWKVYRKTFLESAPQSFFLFFFAASCAWMTSGVIEDFALSLLWLSIPRFPSQPSGRFVLFSARPTMRREECQEQRSVWLKGDLRTALAGTSLKPSKRRNGKRKQQLHGQDPVARVEAQKIQCVHFHICLAKLLFSIR